VKAAGMPPAKKIAEAMLDDKKTSGGRIRLAVPTGGGHCRVVEAPSSQALTAAIEAIRA
jgi:3-dehydroquinate synthetase